ncbi:hypothetical protein C8R43DRAFT_993860 [Mycena crocata]|nr:hypothetical protein C8R43DRAFT_993860 [Mycena crocata]
MNLQPSKLLTPSLLTMIEFPARLHTKADFFQVLNAAQDWGAVDTNEVSTDLVRARAIQVGDVRVIKATQAFPRRPQDRGIKWMKQPNKDCITIQVQVKSNYLTAIEKGVMKPTTSGAPIMRRSIEFKDDGVKYWVIAYSESEPAHGGEKEWRLVTSSSQQRRWSLNSHPDIAEIHTSKPKSRSNVFATSDITREIQDQRASTSVQSHARAHPSVLRHQTGICTRSYGPVTQPAVTGTRYTDANIELACYMNPLFYHQLAKAKTTTHCPTLCLQNEMSAPDDAATQPDCPVNESQLVPIGACLDLEQWMVDTTEYLPSNFAQPTSRTDLEFATMLIGGRAYETIDRPITVDGGTTAENRLSAERGENL